MEHWQSILKKGYGDIEGLQRILGLSDSEVRELKSIQKSFPMFINPYYLSLIDLNDPDDPIRKMSIPGRYESSRIGSFDTSGEKTNTVLPGLQHKYRETALILSTNRCAMYCRHCFRKRLPVLSDKEADGRLEDWVKYVSEHEEISNVLISGGDAFMNSNETIARYLDAFCKIPHLDLIRFGTRTPAVLPQRITSDAELREILKYYSSQKRLYVVTQFNHPVEVTEEAAAAVGELLSVNVPVRNQAVLLKGVNDRAETLGLLLRKLTSIGVIPYYIFQCRPVAGVMNRFQLPLRTGHRIIQQAANIQNGQGKCFRFVMSHFTGKIEIIGSLNSREMLFKYHQAVSPEDEGRIFSMPITESQCWLGT